MTQPSPRDRRRSLLSTGHAAAALDEAERTIDALVAATRAVIVAEAGVIMQHSTPAYSRYAEALRELNAALEAARGTK